MNVTKIPKTIEVDGNELQFIRKNAPTAFARIVSEALSQDGYPVSRVTVHKELHTIKDQYNHRIIAKSRELLKAISKVEYNGK